MAAAFVGCNKPSEPLAPIGTLPFGTTTTNPYAIPAVIDEAYVNRVLAGLDQAMGDMLRLVLSTKSISAEAVDRVTAVYIGRHRQNQLDLLAADYADGFPNYRQPPLNHTTIVSTLLVGTPACIFAEVSRDYSGVSLDPYTENSDLWVVLVPADKYVERSAYNTTNWVYLYDGFEPDGTAPESPCAKV